MNEREFFDVVENAGGTAYLVGGAVRDEIMGRRSSDRDYVVCGIDEEDFRVFLPDAVRVGRIFPVYLADIDGEKCEIAFARKEIKNGTGYKGFAVEYSRETTIYDDLFRRDTTMNSIAKDGNGKIIDPYGGTRDIKDRVIRATSEHFREDPIRALRTARQAAQFEFEIEEKTIRMMEQCGEELEHEPKERKFRELERAMAADHPSLYFINLHRAGLLAKEFPWIFDLIGKTQLADVHPEGDAFEHTMKVLDAAACRSKSLTIRFAALMHDIGKGRTPKELLPLHTGHEEIGAKMLREICARLGVPKKWRDAAEFAAKEHASIRHFRDAARIRDIIRTMENKKISRELLSVITLADSGGKVPEFIKYYDALLKIIKCAAECEIPPSLAGAQIGAFLRAGEIDAVERSDIFINFIKTESA
ncbi:MAG: HD domain-containing protein [Synergistes sp.]|nr:HD domain-containing protein [Synergistes sp.]